MSTTNNIQPFKDHAYVVQHRHHESGHYYIPHGSTRLPKLHLCRRDATEAAAATRKLLGLSRKDVRVLRVHVEMILRWP
jgi:hypothetical protein